MIFFNFYIKGALVQFKILSSSPVSKDVKIKLRKRKHLCGFIQV
jgi:hypothetical protein